MQLSVSEIEFFIQHFTLWSLIDGGVGIVGGLEKSQKLIAGGGGWNNRRGWKKSQKLQ